MTHPFARFADEAWPHRYRVELLVHELHGGVPRNTTVAIDWLKAKLGITDVDRLREMAVEIVGEQPEVNDEQLVSETVKREVEKRLNGFRRDEGGLFIEGRQLKACIKEAASICRAANKVPAKWGATNKGVLGFVAEHVMVAEDRLHIGRGDADEIAQRFVVSRFGTSPSYEEVAFDAKITATIQTDYHFSDREWGVIWLTAEQEGLGASRSQGYGRFVVTDWHPLGPVPAAPEWPAAGP